MDEKVNFKQYLIDKGYKAFRYTEQNGEVAWKLSRDIDTISTMTDGGTCVKFIKDNSVFYYGLNFAGLPPTLLTPNPNTHLEQSETADFISRNDNEAIFKKFYKYSLANQKNKSNKQ